MIVHESKPILREKSFREKYQILSHYPFFFFIICLKINIDRLPVTIPFYFTLFYFFTIFNTMHFSCYSIIHVIGMEPAGKH